jgi:hypothetical protein
VDADIVTRWLQRTWWAIFPAFALLVVRLAFERACGDPYDLLPAASSNAALAWPIAAVYVLGHVWIASAYLIAAERSHSLVPPLALVVGWKGAGAQIVLMLAVLAIEYSPVAVWALAGAAAACRSA